MKSEMYIYRYCSDSSAHCLDRGKRYTKEEFNLRWANVSKNYTAWPLSECPSFILNLLPKFEIGVV